MTQSPDKIRQWRMDILESNLNNTDQSSIKSPKDIPAFVNGKISEIDSLIRQMDKKHGS